MSAGTFHAATGTQLDLAKERDTARQAQKAAWLIAVGQLLAIAVFAVMADGIVKMVRFSIENPSSEEVPPGLGQLMTASVGSALLSPLTLTGMILVLIWFHRAVTNGIALGIRPPREPAVAVASWFIPIVNFWWPYESLRDCVRADDTATRACIKRWWLVYLAMGFGGLVASPLIVAWLPLGLLVGAGAVAAAVYEARLLHEVVARVLTSHTKLAE